MQVGGERYRRVSPVPSRLGGSWKLRTGAARDLRHAFSARRILTVDQDLTVGHLDKVVYPLRTQE